MHSPRGRNWLSPASSTINTVRHDIAEIMLKVALSTKHQSINDVYVTGSVIILYINTSLYLVSTFSRFKIQKDPFTTIFSFMCMFCRSLFVLLYFVFWPLYCLYFFDIRILITPLVSSNSSLYYTFSYLTNTILPIDWRITWDRIFPPIT